MALCHRRLMTFNQDRNGVTLYLPLNGSKRSHVRYRQPRSIVAARDLSGSAPDPFAYAGNV